MMQQKLLVSNMFAFFMLETAEEEKHNWKPEMTLGFYDKTKFTGDLTWHDVKLKYMYGIKLDDIKVNGKNLNVCQKLKDPANCLITVDSGSSANGVPSAAISAFK